MPDLALREAAARAGLSLDEFITIVLEEVMGSGKLDQRDA
jgi:hypothetical protein